MSRIRRTNRGLRKPVGSLWPYNSRSEHDEAKRTASKLVSNAIAAGLLIPEPCEKCGETPTEAHHDDYSKPMQVRWRCRFHHRNVRKSYDPARRRRLDAAMPQILAVTQQVRDAMDAHGLTQRELASLSGVQQPVVHRWFNAGFKTLASLIGAAAALGGEVEIIFRPGQKERSKVA